jgi:hypothetical protein
MDEQAYRYWQVLHRRVALGEMLTTAEQAVYESGCQEMDAAERLGGNLERLRELRAQIDLKLLVAPNSSQKSFPTALL